MAERDRRLIEENVTFAPSAYDAAKEAHAIAVLTEWDEFKTLDAKRVFDTMHRPAFVFDGRNIIDRITYQEIGFEIHSIGKS